MARYAIGDIQGCYSPFIKLLSEIGFNPSCDILYFVGDLVNRGSESLDMLRWAYRNQDNIVMVLGNHDIYLLARYLGVRNSDHDDTLHDVLAAPDAGLLIDWLRRCPLIYQDADYIIVHAGVYPKIDLNQLFFLSYSVSQHLTSNVYRNFIDEIYGNKPNSWSMALPFNRQMKFVVNACTRMRYLESNTYDLNYSYKGELIKKPDSLVPWFDVPFHSTIKKKIIFGHWASLGYYATDKCICIDTGCVWGKKLTAINLDTQEIIQVNTNPTK